MTTFSKMAAFGLFLTLSACSDAGQNAESADDFAARVNGAPAAGGTAQAADGQQYAPKIAAAQPGAAAGPPEAGTQTDPAASSCGANKGGQYLGQADSAQLREAIGQIVPADGSMRVVPYGGVIDASYREKRLNVMLDAGGIIRDLRCG